MISLVLTIALVGFIVWAVTNYVPMPPLFRNAIVVLARPAGDLPAAGPGARPAAAPACPVTGPHRPVDPTEPMRLLLARALLFLGLLLTVLEALPFGTMPWWPVLLCVLLALLLRR